MKKTLLKFFGRFCSGLLMLAFCLFFSYCVQDPGKDCTKEYTIYQDISDMTILSDVTNYLNDNNISYTISKQKLKLDDYDNISYMIYNDNNSCAIIHSDLIYRLSKLDEKDYDIIAVDKITFNDTPTERIYLNKGLLTYSKINDNYFVKNSFIYQFGFITSGLSVFLTFVNLGTDILYETYTHLKKKRENKKLKTESLTTDIKKDSNHN